MQAAMDRLESFTHRHRKLVLLAWLVLLVAAAPFAAKQTEHLTSGGFAVPGSGSETVDSGLTAFDDAQRESLAVVVAQRPGSDAADVRRAIDRVEEATGAVANVTLTKKAAAKADSEAGKAAITVVPLKVDGSQDEAADAASDLRRELELDEGAVRDGVEVHMVGQQA